MKRKSLFFLLILLFTLQAASIVSAKDLEPRHEVERDKVWTITLSHEVTPESVNGNVTITENGNNISLTTTTQGNKIIVKADEFYKSGTKYLLTVHEGLVNLNGDFLEESAMLSFETKEEDKPVEEYNGPQFKNEYELYWKVRDLDYTNLELYSEENGQVVAEYSTRKGYRKHGIKVGDSADKVLQVLGDNATDYILTEDRKKAFRIHRVGESLFYEIDNEYIIYHYDKYNSNKIRSIYWVNKDLLSRTITGYGQPSDELRKGFEDLTVLLINQTRLNEGLKPLTQRNDITFVARAHSEDMVKNNFFAHVNLEGLSPHDRVQKAGFKDLGTGENIFMGPKNAIFAHEGFMNSKGHRDNILKSNYDYTSVGVAFRYDLMPYYTVKLHMQW